MTRATASRNERRGKIAFQRQLQAAFQNGRLQAYNELSRPEGLQLKDGRTARLFIEPAPVVDAVSPDVTQPATEHHPV